MVARWGEGVDLDPLEADAAVGKDERRFFRLAPECDGSLEIHV